MKPQTWTLRIWYYAACSGLSHTLGGGDRCVWRNDGMMIRKRNWRKQRKTYSNDLLECHKYHVTSLKIEPEPPLRDASVYTWDLKPSRPINVLTKFLGGLTVPLLDWKPTLQRSRSPSSGWKWWMTVYRWYLYPFVRSEALPIGVLCSRRAESDSAVTHSSVIFHRVA
jgi:hypothetical protein